VPSMLDAVVVGAGPNGLTAAVELARRGFSVAIFEARDTVGGGARTEELTLPGFRHDPCSAVHPLGTGSPVFATMPLARYGLEWLHSELPMAHPFDDGTAAVLSRSVAETAASFGPRDAGTYRRLVAPFLGKWDTLARDFMSLPPVSLPRDPLTLAGCRRTTGSCAGSMTTGRGRCSPGPWLIPSPRSADPSPAVSA
jgi:phytoene dehydrogenase-like protein